MTRVVELFTVVLYLVPVLVLWAARAREEREVWELALDVPLALSVDLFAVLFVARAIPLEAAVWAVRGVWLAAGAAFLFRDRGRPVRAVRPGLAVGLVLGSAVAVALAVWLSTSLSRDWGMWDRGWQVPLVASVRGQTAPFVNVYQPEVKLHYHYTGVALAAVMQALSFDVLGGSWALSLVHDVYFGLIGLTLAGLLHGAGARRVHLFALATLAVLLNGPISAFRANGPERGYAFLNYIQMSFRPYIAVAGLLFVGIVGAVFVRLEGLRRSGSPWRTMPALVASFLLLAITEEPSAAILGLSLGVAWLVHPDAIHPKRAVGLAALVPMALSIPLGARLFQTSLAAKGTVSTMEIMPWRMPGFELPSLPLSTELGRRVVTFEFFPIAAVCLGLLVVFLAKPSRRRAAMLALVGACAATAMVLVLKVELNHFASDAHRFVIAASFVCPLGAALVLARSGGGASGGRGSAGTALAVAGMALGAHSTLGWVDGIWRNGADLVFGGREMHSKSCRDLVGSKLFERARPTYVAPSVFWAFVGCRPTFIPGTGNEVRVIKTEAPLVGPGAIRELHGKLAKPGDPLRVVCSAAAPSDDPICAYAVPRSSCKEAGARALVCELPAEARAGLPGL